METKMVRTIVITAVLSALSIVFAVTSLGYIPWFGGISITIMHIPVIVAAILEGPIAGTIVGLVFGLTSLLKAASAPTGPVDLLFVNPLVSVLPRLFIGVVAWLKFTAFNGKIKPLAVACSAFFGTATNTILVLTMLGLTSAIRLAEVIGINVNAVPKTLIGIAWANGVPEAIGSIVITLAVVFGYWGITKGKAKIAKEE